MSFHVQRGVPGSSRLRAPAARGNGPPVPRRDPGPMPRTASLSPGVAGDTGWDRALEGQGGMVWEGWKKGKQNLNLPSIKMEQVWISWI